MTWKSFFFAVLAYFTCQPCESQEPVKPAFSAIPTLPGNVSFRKQFDYSAPQKAEKSFAARFPRLVKLEVVRSGTITNKMEYYSDESMTETWQSGEMHFLVHSSAPNQITVTGPGMGADGAAVATDPDFPELDWVTSSLSPKTKFGKA